MSNRVPPTGPDPDRNLPHGGQDLPPDDGHAPVRQALLTGASRGIGAAIARQLLAAGHQVTGLSRQPPDDKQALQAMRHVPVDLTDIASLPTLLKSLLADSDLDTLVCNAGRGDIRALENFSAQQIHDSLVLNLVSPLVLARSCLPSLRRQPRSDIVFIGSESALTGGRYGSVYSAAKFGLRGAAQALRQECAGANCHVGIVNPGMVRTGFFDALDFEPGPDEAHALQCADVASAVLSMISAADHAVIDEITLNPLHHVVRKRRADP